MAANTQTSAKWTVSENTLATRAGTNTGGAVIPLTITNIVNGVYTGHNLAASNFKIGGASGPVTTINGSVVGYQWTGGQVDSPISKVIFTDNGISFDPANTVTATIYINDTAITESNKNKTIYLDIDEISTTVSDRRRSVCINSKYLLHNGHTVTVQDVDDIVESTLNANIFGGFFTNKHQGSVDENTSTKIIDLRFNATNTNGTGHFYLGIPRVVFNNVTPHYNNAYTSQIGNLQYHTTGTNTQVLVGFDVRVYYTPPITGIAAVDIDDMCRHEHEVVIKYKLRTQTSGEVRDHALVTSGGSIRRVNVIKTAPAKGVAKRIEVVGTPGAQYTMQFTKMQSIDSNSIASSNGYYNFSDTTFQTSSSTVTSTIGSNGKDIKYALLPFTETDASYCVVLTSANSSVIKSSAPSSLGDIRITQRGTKKITLTPSTSTASNYGTLPSDKVFNTVHASEQRTRHYDTEYTCTATGSTQVRGQSKGVSTTRLVLNNANKIQKIKKGMFVLGNGVSNGVTVSNISKQRKTITLSTACQVPDNTELIFFKGSDLKAFSFTITPGEGKILNVTDGGSISRSLNKPPGVLSSQTKTIASNVVDSATVVLNDIDGLAVGLTVTGEGISGSPVISSANESNNSITLSQAQDGLSQNTVLTFTGGLGDAYIKHEKVEKIGSNIVISGYFVLGSLEDNVSVNLNIDNLITVTST